jgi:hypothetical protein
MSVIKIDEYNKLSFDGNAYVNIDSPKTNGMNNIKIVHLKYLL